MTPTEQRNALLAQRMIKNLNRRNMDAYYCPTAEEAIGKVMELIPRGSSVSWGGSMTLRDMGLTRALHADGGYRLLDRDLAKDRAEAVEIYLQAFRADYYLSSANAISEDGVIVNIDGNGNRVAAITFGPQHVIFVIGLNKVAQTAEAALARARSTASPSTRRASTSIRRARRTAFATTATRRSASATISTSCATRRDAAIPWCSWGRGWGIENSRREFSIRS